MLRMTIFGFLLSSLAVSQESRGPSRNTIAVELNAAQDMLRDTPAKAQKLLEKIARYPTLSEYPELRFKNIQLFMEYEVRMKIFEQTEQLLELGESLISRINEPKAEIELLLARASYAFEIEKIDGVRTSLNRAYDLSLKIGDLESQAIILSEQGNLDRQELNYQAALIHYLQGYELIKSQKSSDAYSRVANQLAVFYLDGLSVRNDEGIKLLEELVQLAEASDKPRRHDLQIFVSNLGSAYSKKGQFDQARRSFKKGIELAHEIEDWTGLAYCQGYVAVVLMKEKKWAEALPYITAAQKYFVQTHNQHMVVRGAERLMEIYLELGRIPEAVVNSRTLDAAAEKNLPLHQRVEHMRLKGRLAGIEKRWKEAYEAFDQMNRLEEKLNIQKNAVSARYYTALFNLERKDQENRRLEQRGRIQVMQLENKRKQSEVLSWILATVSVIAAIFAVDFFRVRKRRRKTQDLMQSIQRSLLQRYLPDQTVQAVLSGKQSLDDIPSAKKITLLHCEISDFTRAVDILGPARIGRILNIYIAEMMEIIGAEGGTLDKFVNGSLLVFFGAPEPWTDAQQALAASRCAQRMQAKLEELNRIWQHSEGWVFAIRIGMHQGESLIGSLGAEPSLDYTVLGPAVDMALQITNRGAPGEALVSGALAVHLDPKTLQNVSRLRSGSEGEIFSLTRTTA